MTTGTTTNPIAETLATLDVLLAQEEERAARLRLAEVEAKLWASRQKVAVCLALLRLAAGQAEAEEGEEEVVS